MEVTIRHHALESGCFVVNATGWLSDSQIAAITPDPAVQKALRGGCCTTIVSPEGVLLAEPLRSGEGIVIADLDMALITKRKRMMDSVGHYARSELLSLLWDDRPAAPLHLSHPTSLSRSGASDETDTGPRNPEADADRAADQRVAVLRSSSR
jgi:aliphatic nitrilase